MNPLQRLGRSLRVGRTAGGIFLGYRWLGWRNRRLPAEEAKRRLSEFHRVSARRILDTATQLKGLMIKVGQMIGARADVFPDEYVEVLSQLHDAVPPRSYGEIRRVIERELRAPVGDIFSEFAKTPIASASLAQVHRGRLRDGRDVAVKVQYPEIEEVVQVDLLNMRLLARVAGWLLRDFDFTPVIDELRTAVPLELDFIQEGRNAEAVARNFERNEDVVVPRIYWEHSTRRVLVMEFVDGIKITDMATMDAAGIERQAVARLVADTYFTQILSHGFLHADPHPGNLFVRPGPKLVIVDFGLAKELSPTFVRDFLDLTTALMRADREAAALAFRKLGFRTRHADDAVFHMLGEAMVTRLSRNGEFNQDREMLLQFQQQMMRVIRENPVVRVPGEFIYIGRVMGLLAGLGAQLGSQVNLLEAIGAHLAAPARTPS